jgi:hypothetical protein
MTVKKGELVFVIAIDQQICDKNMCICAFGHEEMRGQKNSNNRNSPKIHDLYCLVFPLNAFMDNYTLPLIELASEYYYAVTTCEHALKLK